MFVSSSFFVEFIPLWYIILTTDKHKPSNIINFISPVTGLINFVVFEGKLLSIFSVWNR